MRNFLSLTDPYTEKYINSSFENFSRVNGCNKIVIKNSSVCTCGGFIFEANSTFVVLTTSNIITYCKFPGAN